MIKFAGKNIYIKGDPELNDRADKLGKLMFKYRDTHGLPENVIIDKIKEATKDDIIINIEDVDKLNGMLKELI